MIIIKIIINGSASTVIIWILLYDRNAEIVKYQSPKVKILMIPNKLKKARMIENAQIVKQVIILAEMNAISVKL